MKKLIATLAIAGMTAFVTQGARAADFDAQQAIQELVVSGIVDSWSGYTFLTDLSGNAEPDPEEYFSSGLSGRLSLPLGDMLSIQTDGDLEYTDNAFNARDSSNIFNWSSQFGSHLTWRDPGMGAIGAFGAFGRSRADERRQDFFAVGGEAQYYLDDLTLYLQAGYLDAEQVLSESDDADDRFRPFHDAVFVRGVARWFITPDSRLQGQVIYAAGKQDNPPEQDMDIIEWAVRYDMVLAGLPVIGDTPVYVGYRGTYYDQQGESDGGDAGEFTEHTIMVGTTYSFGGNTMREFDLIGASFDLPSFGRWVGAGSQLN